jgi:hypothetical protein
MLITSQGDRLETLEVLLGLSLLTAATAFHSTTKSLSPALATTLSLALSAGRGIHSTATRNGSTSICARALILSASGATRSR